MPEGTPEQAMQRVANAILAADYMTAMVEATPEALLQAMELGSGIMNLPPPEGCEITPLDFTTPSLRFKVRFFAGAQNLSAVVTWTDVEGAWKITGISDVEAS